VISSSQGPLPDNTRHSQQTNIHAPGGIRTHDLSRWAPNNASKQQMGFNSAFKELKSIGEQHTEGKIMRKLDCRSFYK